MKDLNKILNEVLKEESFEEFQERHEKERETAIKNDDYCIFGKLSDYVKDHGKLPTEVVND